MIDYKWLVQEQNALTGIDFRYLCPGTKLLIKTKNNDYELTVVEDGKIQIKGGYYFPKETLGYLAGSTWGGSVLKRDWIGFGMHMELVYNDGKKTITTSGVQKATIVGDGWVYDMDWANHIFQE